MRASHTSDTPLPDDKEAYQTCVLQDSEEAADACRRRVIDEDVKGNPDYQAASKRDKFGERAAVPYRADDGRRQREGEASSCLC